MRAIVAVDLNWGIGYRGELLENIPMDMKYFKENTINKVVVMGRATLESLPQKKPLKDRINIVLSRNSKYKNLDIILCDSLKMVLKKIECYDSDDVFIIGGESIYKIFLPYCKEVLVTKIKKEYKADKYFINLDENENWELVQEGEVFEYKDIKFQFSTYKNKQMLNK